MKNHKYGGRKIAAFLIIIAGMFLLGTGILTKRICPNKIAANAYAVKGMDVSHHQGAIAWEQGGTADEQRIQDCPLFGDKN